MTRPVDYECARCPFCGGESRVLPSGPSAPKPFWDLGCQNPTCPVAPKIRIDDESHIRASVAGWNRRVEPFGATGDYPEGKLTPNDEGAVTFGVAKDGNLVRVKFGSPVKEMAMPQPTAISFARQLLKHAGAKIVRIDFGGDDEPDVSAADEVTKMDRPR